MQFIQCTQLWSVDRLRGTTTQSSYIVSVIIMNRSGDPQYTVLICSPCDYHE